MADYPTEGTLDGYRGGDEIAGRYTLLEELGAGSMGVVWRASDGTLDGEPVCLKFLRPGIAADDRYVTAMKHEARKLFRLTHPNVCRLRDFGRDPSRAGCVFLVMEYIPGRSLRHLLSDSRGGLDPLRVVRWAEQIARAVDHAHEERVLHRDIKPSNILIDEAKDRAVLCDFGIARTSGGDTVGGVGATSGTPEYMSPQQFRGLDSPRNDVYSLAATLYECLAGEPPFTGTGTDLQRKIDAHAPQAIPGLSDTLNRALLKALSKDDAQRQATASELVADMKAGLGPLSGSEPPIGAPMPLAAPAMPVAPAPVAVEAPAPQPVAAAPAASVEPAADPSASPHGAWWLLAAVLLAAAVVAAVPAWRERGIDTVAAWFFKVDPNAAPPAADAGPSPAPASGLVQPTLDDINQNNRAVEARLINEREIGVRGVVATEAERETIGKRIRDRGFVADLTEVRVDGRSLSSQMEAAFATGGHPGVRVTTETLHGGREVLKVQFTPGGRSSEARIRTFAEGFVFDTTTLMIQPIGGSRP